MIADYYDCVVDDYGVGDPLDTRNEEYGNPKGQDLDDGNVEDSVSVDHVEHEAMVMTMILDDGSDDGA